MLQAVFDADRLRRPGEIRRPEYRWQFDLGLRESSWGDRWKGNVALHRNSSGEVDGYARYAPKEIWEERQPRGTITVNELIALDDEAYGALWRFLGELDLVATVKAEGRRRDERLPWLLTNARAVVESDVGDGALGAPARRPAGARGARLRAQRPASSSRSSMARRRAAACGSSWTPAKPARAPGPRIDRPT